MALLSCFAYGQGEYQKYAILYQGCVDDEVSTIYGGSYGAYPENFNDAQFPGGDVELASYVYQNTNLVEVFSGEKDIDGEPLLVTGKVIIQVVIDRCGKPGQFQIVQSLTEEQDAEAMRVVEGLPIFMSASIDGMRVKSAYHIPVSFNKPRRPPVKKEEEYVEDDDDWGYGDYSDDSGDDGWGDSDSSSGDDWGSDDSYSDDSYSDDSYSDDSSSDDWNDDSSSSDSGGDDDWW